MPTAFICDGIRTPIGRYGSALSAVRTDDLAALPIADLIQRNPAVDWTQLDDVVFGCANQAGEDNRNVARMAALLAGLPVSVPGVTITDIPLHRAANLRCSSVSTVSRHGGLPLGLMSGLALARETRPLRA